MVQRHCAHQQSCSTSNPVSAGMGDRLLAGMYTVLVSNQPPTPSQLSWVGDEYRSKCGEALLLGTKGRYDSLHLD